MSEIVEMQAQGQQALTKPYQAPTQTTPADLLRIAVEQGADLDKLERLMDLQDRYNAAQAKKAYDAAFAAFKAEGVTILKGRKVTDGPLRGKSYAELHDVVNAVTAALSKHGLSSSWKLTRDEKDWLEVTCYLRHTGGHEESVSMGGPPDVGGAKNAIQARASAKTYLERYTLKAILGLSEQDDDKDGVPPIDMTIIDDWVSAMESAATIDEWNEVWRDGLEQVRKTNSIQIQDRFKAAAAAAKKRLTEAS